MKYTAIIALLLATESTQAIHLLQKAEPAADAKDGAKKEEAAGPPPVPLDQQNILPAAAIAATKAATESQTASQAAIAQLVADTKKLVGKLDKQITKAGVVALPCQGL